MVLGLGLGLRDSGTVGPHVLIVFVVLNVGSTFRAWKFCLQSVGTVCGNGLRPGRSALGCACNNCDNSLISSYTQQQQQQNINNNRSYPLVKNTAVLHSVRTRRYPVWYFKYMYLTLIFIFSNFYLENSSLP